MNFFFLDIFGKNKICWDFLCFNIFKVEKIKIKVINYGYNIYKYCGGIKSIIKVFIDMRKWKVYECILGLLICFYSKVEGSY